jgi:hypothetical protein
VQHFPRFKDFKAAPVFLALLFLFTACQAQPEVVTKEVEASALPVVTLTPVVISEEAEEIVEEEPQEFGQTAVFILGMEEEARIGEEFIVNVLVDTGGQEVDMVQVNLNFDPGFLEIIEIEVGDVLTVMMQSEFDNETGMIDYAAGLLGESASGEIQVMRIRMKALQEMATGIQLSFNFGLPRETSVYSRGQAVLKNGGAEDFLIELMPVEE